MPYSVVCQPAAMFWACTAGVWCALWRRDRASWLPSTAGPTPTLTSPDCGTALAMRGDPPALSTLMCDAGPFGEPTGAQPRRAVLLCGSVSRFRVMALRVEWHSNTLQPLRNGCLALRLPCGELAPFCSETLSADHPWSSRAPLFLRSTLSNGHPVVKRRFCYLTALSHDHPVVRR